ncbi:MAG: hypothetical protein US96_C0020G0010 [Candidatus Woesebacteria bacterium GW2011_GWB1_38_5b]|uniref:Uncharacterized protein n=1 Tax=Candidatus Woesebacteria bacterium GW2011_GWB1_38_5b TaxID=1618569 RepID=A0A0G0MMQ3_9BACT|nr:MAG: hypothetical protein US96_C0020G0010 [Candidatus Woesebacteria bacterium GW2011_GWB1_38_5b]OGH48266.1 MAG: hypothetical protein A3A51_00490 [Candidatus Levybacteria bacterium RIFCSPLOWO2_01_FULL_39_10]
MDDLGLMLVKFAFLLVIFMYVVFSLVVLKQSYAMKNVINYAGLSPVINMVAAIHVIIGVLIFVTALLIL